MVQGFGTTNQTSAIGASGNPHMKYGNNT